jgi:hypothetical protein
MAPNFAERIRAVDPERFRFALGVYAAAAAMKGPYPNPEEFSLNLVDDDGSVSEIRFTDRPENRGMIALKGEFPDLEELECIGFRIMTMPKVIKNRQLIKMGLIRNGESGNIEIHDAVVNALAKVPFRKSGALDKSVFLALVRSERQRLEAIEASEDRATTKGSSTH